MAKQKPQKSVSQPEKSNTSKSIELIQLEQELKTVDPHVFEGIPSQKKEAILKSISFTMVSERTHSGPLPDPDTLSQYNTIITDGGNRLMSLVEKQ